MSLNVACVQDARRTETTTGVAAESDPLSSKNQQLDIGRWLGSCAPDTARFTVQMHWLIESDFAVLRYAPPLGEVDFRAATLLCARGTSGTNRRIVVRNLLSSFIRHVQITDVALICG
jgi:hypothetical protein